MNRESVAMIATWLYVPADRPDRLDKAAASSADAVIADLEDGVAAARKAAARSSLAEWLDRVASPPSIWVRIDAASIADDLAAACHPSVDGVCLPKAATIADVREVCEHLDRLEHDDPKGRGSRPPTSLMLLIETAAGVLDCAALARASDRIAILQLGEQDLRADLSLRPNRDDDALPHPLRAARDAVVLASAAARLAPPVAPVSLAIHDADRLAAETAQLRADGFGSRAVIHPAQLDPVRRGLAATTAELEWAERVVAADALARSQGAAVTVVDGHMVDAPVVAAAQTLLHRSRLDRPPSDLP
jgi:citrate lyase subunit beta/citryl-CoA lyase